MANATPHPAPVEHVCVPPVEVVPRRVSLVVEPETCVGLPAACSAPEIVECGVVPANQGIAGRYFLIAESKTSWGLRLGRAPPAMVSLAVLPMIKLEVALMPTVPASAKSSAARCPSKQGSNPRPDYLHKILPRVGSKHRRVRQELADDQDSPGEACSRHSHNGTSRKMAWGTQCPVGENGDGGGFQVQECVVTQECRPGDLTERSPWT
jgi:hypothetical protein